MTASHGLEYPTYMVPLSTGSQHPRCTQKHQVDHPVDILGQYRPEDALIWLEGAQSA